MRAVVKTAPAPGSVSWQEWPEPEVSPTDVLIEIRSAGVCSTDVATYDWTHVPRRPIETPCVLGHEAAGVVIAVGSEIDDIQIGEHVAVQVIWGHPHSAVSLRGYENLDPDWFQIGATSLGGTFAERFAVRADKVIRLPETLPWEDAALLEPMACAMHALEPVSLRAGDRIVIVGPGQFGLLIAQIASQIGAGAVILVGLDGVDESRLQRGREIGATATVAIGDDLAPALEAIHDATGGEEADIVFEAAGTPEAAKVALASCGPAAHLVMFGYARSLQTDPFLDIVRKGITISGVCAARREHYYLALKAIIGLGIRPSAIVSRELPMSAINEAIEGVRDPCRLKGVTFSSLILSLRSKGLVEE